MKKAPFIAMLTMLSMVLSFAAFAAATGTIVPYKLDNSGTATCTFDGKAGTCPPDVNNLQITQASYDTNTLVFQFTQSQRKVVEFPSFVNDKAQHVACVSETGDGPITKISCDNFGYPTTPGTKNFMQTLRATYNPVDQGIQMSLGSIEKALTSDGKHDGSVRIDGITFLPSSK